MSVVDARSLKAWYDEALSLGEELLHLLEVPSPDMGRVMDLAVQREAAADGAGVLIDSGADVAPFRAELEALLAQQERLGTALNAAMRQLQARHTASRAQQRNLQDVRRLLHQGPQSKHLNERR